MMTNTQDEGFSLDDTDRLPWLEPAEEDYGNQGPAVTKILGLVLLGLILIGIIAGGGYWLKNRSTGSDVDAHLIPAQQGSYKIAAKDSEGKAFQGQGDTSYATSEGVETNGKVDASRVPEAPMAGISRGSIAKDQAAPSATRAAPTVTAAVKDATKAAKPTPATTSGTGSSALIQLGAYGSESGARDAWTKLTKRFDYLAALSNSIEKTDVGGATLYRLRAGAGSAANASTLCGKLKVAGESCIVVK